MQAALLGRAVSQCSWDCSFRNILSPFHLSQWEATLAKLEGQAASSELVQPNEQNLDPHSQIQSRPKRRDTIDPFRLNSSKPQNAKRP